MKRTSQPEAAMPALSRDIGAPLMTVRALANGEAELLIYGNIGDSWLEESVSAISVAQQLQALPANTSQINVRINSYGGSVSDGMAIYNALRRHPARKVVTVDGVAMSSASLIAMAGDEVQMPALSLLMIHAPWGLAQGNALDMRGMADVLDQYATTMAAAYAHKSGTNEPDMLALLQDGVDHYYNGEQALEAGFADTLIGVPTNTEDANAQALANARASDLDRLLDDAPEDIRQLAHAAARRHPLQLPTVEKPRIRLDGETRMKLKTHRTQRFQAPADTHQGGGGGAPSAAAIRERNQTIVSMMQPFVARGGPTGDRIQELMTSALVDPSMSVEAVRQQVMDMLGQRGEPLAGVRDIHIHEDPRVDFVQAASDALLMRNGYKVEKPHAGARDFMRTSLIDIARASLSRSGRSPEGFEHKHLVKAALSTSDFPELLANTTSRALSQGYENEPSSHKAWVRAGRVPDFKPQTRIALGSAPDLKKVPEYGEYQNGAMDENASVPFSVEKFGRIVQLSREAIINDNFGAFLRITSGMGQAASRLEADEVYNLFGLNAGTGQSMQDEKALFHVDHANLAGAVSGLDADALGAARTMLRKQKAVGGGLLNLVPRVLLVPAELEQTAEVLLAASAARANQGSDQQMVAPWISSLELVVEPRLAASAFYLLASTTQIDTAEMATLQDEPAPHIEEEDGFRVDARSWKVRHQFGVRFIDWRGIVKTPIN
ncbi:ClpP-like prohead protease/major capsid protein fusion protein [Oleiagrimonas sp. C23AA]|uniref:ClpP-like prohead protease/major capsid protein fusion protein n=1 Tax=Oleiagrimonas sp. C23AA TaxID=2719047 RepID=UPI00142409FD|nr:ClpP-like prohead protease/major capsid protein fusion protein [Oleiagrimonas sp. C23AA]NII11761.1 Clp protease ClpP [Oleiagrimonas sp. C23AA]